MIKKHLLTILLSLLLSHAFGQTSKNTNEDKLNFSFNYISCVQFLNDALNYNLQPEIFKAFLNEADRHLDIASRLFNENKVKWSPKLAPLTIKDVEKLLEQYKEFTTKETTLTEQEMMSAGLWLKIVDKKNKDIIQKLNK
jgi:hypothetical protein